ncbi:MAG: nodulation protein NfeD, partial [SAR324 cluster bacterium]|nr:nodulation protein NfeD [SAR324 cluster bacterium]
ILASHVAAMAPATNLGAAHPVSLFGLGGDNKVMGEKIVNDTSAFIEGIARLRGRNAEWAISAVRESKSITADRALELNVIEIVAENLTDLVRQLDGRQVRMSESRTITLNTLGKPIILREMGFSLTFRSLLANPNLVFLLLIVGLVGLYIEFSNPGMFFPGIIGAISLLLALIALQTLPVSYGAVGLIFLGVALLVAEAFIPSFGILGIGGLISMLIGSIFLFDPETTDLRVSLPIVFGSVITVGVIGMVVGRLIVKSFRAPTVSFQDNLVGKTAEVREKIGPGRRGRVFLNGELWMAVSEATLKEGQKVVVESAEGLVLKVARGSGDAAATPTQPRVAT